MTVGVIGVGNQFVADDGVGILAVRKFREAVADERVACVETERGGLDLLDQMSGFDAVIIIDASTTGRRAPGSIFSYTLRQPFLSARSSSTHTIDLNAALAFGSSAGMHLPEEVSVFAIEAADAETYREGCSREVEAAVPVIIGMLTTRIQQVLPDLRLASFAGVERRP